MIPASSEVGIEATFSSILDSVLFPPFVGTFSLYEVYVAVSSSATGGNACSSMVRVTPISVLAALMETLKSVDTPKGH